MLNRNDYPLWYIDKQIRLFLKKGHESPITQKYYTGDYCESLKTSESKAIFLFLRSLYLGITSVQIEKEIHIEKVFH